MAVTRHDVERVDQLEVRADLWVPEMVSGLVRRL